MKYLLLGTAAAVAGGIALAGGAAVPWWTALLGAALVGSALVFDSPLPLLGAALVLGLLLGHPGPPPAEDLRRLPFLTEISGEVAGAPEFHRSTVSFPLKPPGFASMILVYLPRGLVPTGSLIPGTTIHVSGEGEIPDPAGWREHLLRQGITGVFWGRTAELEGGRAGLSGWLSRWRYRLLEKLNSALPGQGAELLGALLFGERGLLPGETKTAFRSAGVAHLLALSGLHLGILAAIGWGVLGIFKLGRGTRYLVLLPLVWGYVLLVGGRLSLVRAAIMLSFLGLFTLLWDRGWVLWSWYEPLESLGAAALVVLAAWPWSALDLGFQLSFAATFAIIYLWPSWSRAGIRRVLPRPLRWGADMLATSAFAQAGALPLAGSGFGYIAPWGIMGNLLLIPWTGVLLGGGLVLLALPSRLAQAAGSWLHRLVIAPYLGAVQGLAGLPGARLTVGRWFGLWYLVAALGLILLAEAREATPDRLAPWRRPGQHRTYPE